MPDIARQLLARILDATARGRALSVVPLATALTTTQAAEYLTVSRPYLVRLLREGKLPFHTVGTHRRLRLRDLQAYKDLAFSTRESLSPVSLSSLSFSVARSPLPNQC